MQTFADAFGIVVALGFLAWWLAIWFKSPR